MSSYEDFKKYQGIPYVEGKRDCYGLILQIYEKEFGIKLTNPARPQDFWRERPLDIFSKTAAIDGWKIRAVNMRMLKPGDVIGLAIGFDEVNHVGMYVGNSEFIHHLVGRTSIIETLSDKWTSRALSVLRHPGVKQDGVITELEDILPDHVKRKLNQIME